MKNLNAFVAHSFHESDEELINKFLQFFDALKEPTGFSWDHAEKGELKAVSKKVMEKMENKDLFIGIFTGKDYRIEAKSLKTLLGKWCYATKHFFKQGASDWIIQESGYALAKGMSLLFLIEEGIDISMGLQGDLEYLTFKRANPSQCFPKIMEMIGSILRESRPIISAEVSIPSRPSKEEEAERKPEKEIQIVSEKEKFFRNWDALSSSITIDRDLLKAEGELKRILADYGENEAFPPPYWKSLSSYFKIKAGFSEGLEELRELCVKYQDTQFPFRFLADSLKGFKQYSEAAKQYLNASEKAGPSRIRIIGEAAECYVFENRSEIAFDLLLKEFPNVSNDDDLCYLYKQMALISKKVENNYLFEAFGERALELSPLDHDLRFSLAYHYGERSNAASSLFHYSFLRERRPDGMSLNNIGFTYGSLDIKNKSVEAYKEAIEKHQETLAMANMAGIHIGAGLLNEAEAILEKARGKGKYHKNVDIMMTRIKEDRENEEKSEEKILEKTATERKFLVNFAEAYSLPWSFDIRGEWQSKHGVVPINVEGNTVLGHKEIEEPFLSGLLAARPAIPFPQSSKKELIFKGKLRNRAIEYEFLVKRISPTPSLLTSGEQNYKGLMIISKDGQVMEVMEKGGNGEAKFYEMKKIK